MTSSELSLFPNMKILQIVKVVGVVASAVVFSSCSSEQIAIKNTTNATASSSSASSGSREARLARQIHDEVNNYRASIGLKKLKFHSGLAKLAKPHSRYMMENAGSFNVIGDKGLVTHFGVDARATLAEKKYRIESMSENVLASYRIQLNNDAPAKMLKAWLGSSGHRHNIESKWHLSGVAVVIDDQGRAFATQIFGSAPSQVLMIGGPQRTF